MFFLVYDSDHWHVHVVNIVAETVDILSSLSLKRQNRINAVSRRLSLSISKALHVFGLYMNVDVSKFEHVQPDIVQHSNW